MGIDATLHYTLEDHVGSRQVATLTFLWRTKVPEGIAL